MEKDQSGETVWKQDQVYPVKERNQVTQRLLICLDRQYNAYLWKRLEKSKTLCVYRL